MQYDGKLFQGWQVQASGRTIQGEIESALKQIHPNEKVTLHGSGRTDSGVHAKGQVASVKLNSSLNPHQLLKALNSKLKKDIRIVSCIEAQQDFHARFSAKYRKYQFYLSFIESPFNYDRSWNVKFDISFTLLDDCAKLIIGEHDFTGFSKSNDEILNKKCVIFESRWEQIDDEFRYTVIANRFLQHMVRFLVGTMIEVARGRMSIGDFKLFLKGGHPSLAVVRAPAHGLYLVEVTYD